MSEQLHAEFRSQGGISFLLGLGAVLIGGIFLTLALMLLSTAGGLVRGFVAGELPSTIVLWALVLLSLGIGGGALYMGRYFIGVRRELLPKATWLVSFSQPERLAMTFPGKRGLRGVLVEVQKSGDLKRRAKAVEVVEIRSPRSRIHRDCSPEVEVFREAEPGRLVVIRTDRGLLWGLRKERVIRRPNSSDTPLSPK